MKIPKPGQTILLDKKWPSKANQTDDIPIWACSQKIDQIQIVAKS